MRALIYFFTVVLAVSAASVGPVGAQSLDSLTSVDIGPGVGTTTVSGDTLTISTTGFDVWGESDDFRFVYRELAGDMAVEGTVISYTGPSEWGKVGLILRESLDPQSRFVDIVRTRDNGLEFQHRPVFGKDVQTIATDSDFTGLPVELTLFRESTLVSGYYREMGGSWTRIGTIEFVSSDSLFAGFLATSEEGTDPGIGSITNVFVGNAACVETAPEFDDPPDQAVYTGTTLRIELSPYVYGSSCNGDIEYAVVSGEGQIDDSAFVWTPVVPGESEIVLSATNLVGSTEASFTVTVLDADSAISALSVDGRHIIDEDSNRVILRGVALAGLEHIEGIHGVSPNWVAEMAIGHGAKVVRMTIEPEKWLANPSSYTVDFVDPLVALAMKEDFYVIVDWHYIADGTEQGPEYTEVDEETRRFWSAIAPRYAGIPNVIYELFNEPAKPDNWNTWRATAQPWIDIIRESADNLLLVSGLWYSSHLYYVLDDPFQGDNLAYVAHVYPDQAGHTNPNPEAVWEKNWGLVADHHPVVVTEWGYENYPGPHWSGGTQENYGEPLRAYIESKGMGWTAWCYDIEWGPRMFDSDWELMGGNDFMGEFVVDWLGHHAGGPAPAIFVSESRLDFGVHSAGNEHVDSLYVANTGEGPLEVSFSSPHRQFALDTVEEGTKYEVLVGDSIWIQVRFLSLGGGLQQGEVVIQHNALGAEMTVDVSGFSRGAATSVEDGEVPGQFAFLGTYPNPFSDRFTVDVSLPDNGGVTFDMYDAYGRIVHTKRLVHLPAGLHSIQVDGSDLSAGVYFIRVNSSAGRVEYGTVTLIR